MKYFAYFLITFFGLSSLPIQAQIGSQDEKPVLLAKAKRKKRKKRPKPVPTEDGLTFGAENAGELDPSDTGVGIHRVHEGVDTPYWAEFGGQLKYTAKTKGEGDTATKDSTMGLGGDLFFLLGMFSVGPTISIQTGTSENSSLTYEDDGTLKGSEIVETKNTNLGIGVGGKFYIGDIDRDLNVLYGLLKVNYLMGNQTIGDGDATKTAGTAIIIGGGLHLFLDSNIALTPEFTYDMSSLKADTDGAEEVKSSELTVGVGISTFI